MNFQKFRMKLWNFRNYKGAGLKIENFWMSEIHFFFGYFGSYEHEKTVNALGLGLNGVLIP